MRDGLFATSLVLVCFVVIGCGGSKTAQVNGTIVYSDAPNEPAKDLEGYTVTFEAVEGNTSSVGVVGADGKFTMSTFKEGDGALRGKMKVAVTPPVRLSDSSLGPSKIDPRHNAFETSGLDLEIGPGVNQFTLKVDRAKKASP